MGGAGSWIQANFGKSVTLTSFKYMQRGCQCEHNKGIRLMFSDGSSQDYELRKDNSLQTLVLRKPVYTSYVKLQVLSVHSTVNNGANEIQYFGFAAKGCGSGDFLYSSRRILHGLLSNSRDRSLQAI